MRWKEMELAGWGRALKSTAAVARPERRSALAGAAAPAIGNRRSYGDAALNGGGKVIDMTRLDRVLELEAATGLLRVEAGARIGELAQLLAPRGWLPAVMPGTGFATVGGCIAMDVHGKNHHGAGSFGMHLAEIELIVGGEARPIGPDDPLWRATIGGLGQTGIITAATLRLIPAKGRTMRVREQRVEGWDEHIALLDSSDASYTVGWIDATATGARLGRGILEEGEISDASLPPAGRSRKVPLDAPGFALSSPVVRVFNAAYYARVPAQGRTVTRAQADFFFPLDRIHDWNRLYGKRGFHQFQCVVPPAQKDALRDMLRAIAQSGLASPLAVLKRMGPGRAGMLSFPMEGYTLAVDFPNRAAARSLIAALEDLAIAAEGRIYFAKDSLAGAAQVRAMYPELADWQAAVSAADPDRALETDIVRRLRLRDPA
ncbi:MAG: FAD-binding protein [Limimaricola sp.]|nr:FAD-binding oxidoreductase [Limimaricola sp.]MBI1419016.1 FAD-binding protein [Limimaricola sp.]